jgi:hypothetical protein
VAGVWLSVGQNIANVCWLHVIYFVQWLRYWDCDEQSASVSAEVSAEWILLQWRPLPLFVLCLEQNVAMGYLMMQHSNFCKI